MKLTPLAQATLLALVLLVTLTSARADITVSPGYSISTYYTDPSNGAIAGYDWSASNTLYYATATASGQFGGLYQPNPITPTSPTQLVAGNSQFEGTSVISLGNYVYFNDGNNTIYTYNASNSTFVGTSAINNYALFKQAGQLYIAGSPITPPPTSNNNAISVSAVGVGGALSVTTLEQDSAYSGPLAFDTSGNLYYAPGYNPSGTNSIFEWSAAQVAAAVADPAGHGLVIGSSGSSGNASLWDAYGAIYGSYAGGTSLVIDNNQLFLTLTNFGGPSALVAFGLNSDNSYSGISNVVLTDDASTGNSLGQLGINNGTLFISDGNQILAVVPEPSTFYLLALGLTGLIYYRSRRARRVAPVVAFIATTVFFSVSPVQAGPFSPAADQPGSNGVSASDPSIVEWANTVVNLTRGPVNITNPTGAKASFGTASNALGPADSTQSNPNNVVSLGDGGSITLSFAQPITNGAGADFAVFENGFPQSGVSNSYFLELATVAVSSDGVNFFTFPSVSLTPTTTQVGSYGTLDPTNLYNLAGSEIVGYGTPFNLDDLAGVSPLLNINAVTQIRVTDVIGNINTSLGSGTYTYDDASNPIFNGAYGTVNHIINDPYATPFNSGGFDLDAIGVLNVVPEPSAVSYLLLGLGAIIAVRRYSSVKSKV